MMTYLFIIMMLTGVYSILCVVYDFYKTLNYKKFLLEDEKIIINELSQKVTETKKGIGFGSFEIRRIYYSKIKECKLFINNKEYESNEYFAKAIAIIWEDFFERKVKAYQIEKNKENKELLSMSVKEFKREV